MPATKANADEGDAGDEDTYGGEQETEQSGTLDADGKLQITIPTRVNTKKQDLIYRIEARVTDQAIARFPATASR